MAEQEDYQGWTNYETWHVNLMWTQAEEARARWLDDLAEEVYRYAIDQAGLSRLENATHALAGQMRDQANQGIPFDNPDNDDYFDGPPEWVFYAAFIRAGLERVNWLEIAIRRLTPELIARVEEGDELDEGERHEPIPSDHPVQPLESGEKAEDKATCGHCGLSWDDAKVTSMTPAPGARCPFEAFHIYR